MSRRIIRRKYVTPAQKTCEICGKPVDPRGYALHLGSHKHSTKAIANGNASKDETLEGLFAEQTRLADQLAGINNRISDKLNQLNLQRKEHMVNTPSGIQLKPTA